MDNLLDFQVIKLLKQNNYLKLFRGREAGHDRPYFIQHIRSLNGFTLPPPTILRHYDEIRNLNVDSALKICGLKNNANQVAIIYEDFEGQLLENLLIQAPLSLKSSLGIGLAIAEAIAQFHKNGLTHGAIRPDNILINPSESVVKLFQTPILALSTTDSSDYTHPSIIKEILPYLSPEQSGRMKHDVDFRSDMYAMGVLLYQMLTGNVPFQFNHPLEMIHAHIARIPPRPREIAPHIPTIVSDIVMRLLSKAAEKRYRSMFGLMEDLNECLLRLEMTGEIAYFELGTKDMPLSFSLPLRIIGRDEEIKALLAIFKRIQQGHREMVFVSGPPGIGKSVLINELHSTVAAQNAFFCWGKYEKIGQDTPFSALIFAFRRLVRIVLSLSKLQIEVFRDRLANAIGGNGRIITDIFPDVELIIGPQQSVPILDAQATQVRFTSVFKAFIKTFATKDHPLVLFLDDLQWADSASIDLMKILLLDSDVLFLYFIGIYRDNEIHQGHSLARMRRELENSSIVIYDLRLPHLTSEHLNHLISDFLQCPPQASFPLAELVYRKTNGNPFFFNQFMKTLVDRDLLFLSPQSGWQWNAGKINKMPDTDNVADLMISKVKQLTPTMIVLLSSCACLGRRFKIDLLPSVLEMPRGQLLSALDQASQQGFISVSDDCYLFNHDRIHEALYNFLPEQERQILHLKIGRIASTKPFCEAYKATKRYFIVNQFNLGRMAIVQTDELKKLIQLNYEAGRMAKSSAAYSLAWHYFQIATGLTNATSWDGEYEFTLTLYNEAVEAAYLATAFEAMRQLAATVIDRAKSILDKVAIFEMLIKLHLSQNEPIQAVEMGIECLRQLHLHFPQNPHRVHHVLGLLQTQLALQGQSLKNLVNLPEMSAPLHLAQIQIISAMAPAVYWVRPPLLPLLVFKTIQMAVKYGNSKLSPYNYAGYGLILCGIGLIDQGYQMGRLAMRLVKRDVFSHKRSRTHLVFYSFIYHWKNHAFNTLDHLRRTCQNSLDSGDLEFAAFSLRIYCFHTFYLSKSLDTTQSDLMMDVEALKRFKQETQLNMARLTYKVVNNLKNRSKHPCQLGNSPAGEHDMINRFQKLGDRTTLFNFYTYKLILFYLFGKYTEALKVARQARNVLDSVIGTLISTGFHFFEALTILAVYGDATVKQKRQFNRRISWTLRKMKYWAKHAPMNFAHQYHLILAERFKIRGKSIKAIESYNQALRLATQNEYVLHEAIIRERLAHYFIDRDHRSLARYYLLETRDSYKFWGATTKVHHLEQTYVSYFAPIPPHNVPQKVSNLDYASVVNSLQALSKEIQLPELLQKLTNIMAENAGADKVLFISVIGDQMHIEAERHIGANGDSPRKETIIKKTAIENRDDLLRPAVYYVKRTAEFLLLDDVENLGDYTQDTYVTRNRPQSILCLPIIRQGKLSAILYLENGSTKGAFTADRIEILQLLSSQIAISHENALLYDHLSKADKALIESERQYRLLAENVTDNIWVWDIASQKFLYHSPSVKLARGFTQEEAMALSLEQTLTPASYEKAMNALKHELKNENERRHNPRRSVTLEIETYCKDGSTVVTEATMRFIRNEQGQPASVLGVSRDITGRKKAETKIKQINVDLENRVAKRTLELQKSLETLKNTQDQLIQSEKMAALGGLVAGVAHEINTPLSVGLTASTLLEEKTRLQKELYEKGLLKRSDLEKYLSTASDASSLINNNLLRVAELVQSFKQVAVDQSTEQCRRFKVKAHIHELLTSLRPKLKKTKHEIQVNCSNDIEIYSYPGFFYQILTNLILNSLMHGFENIENGRIIINIHLSHNILHLNYSDNGHGMDKTTLQKLYDPFFTTKRSQGGTGLGMHIVYNVITHSLEGQIDCVSQKDHGVHFNIRIPLIAKPDHVIPHG